MGLWIRFSRALDFFLAKDRQGKPIGSSLNRRASVKDLVESLGVPHTEIGAIEFNQKPVDFSFLPANKGEIRVRGIKSFSDVRVFDPLRPEPLPSIKFVADLNVIKLGRYLLILGFYVCLAFDLSDAEIDGLAQVEKRFFSMSRVREGLLERLPLHQHSKAA